MMKSMIIAAFMGLALAQRETVAPATRSTVAPRETVAPRDTVAPATREPITTAPVTRVPVTNPPTSAPVTNPPVTNPPATFPPVTSAPVTTAAPTTGSEAEERWNAALWTEMLLKDQRNWMNLGWTRELWRADRTGSVQGQACRNVPTECKTFTMLTITQQNAVIDLGFTSATWDSRELCPACVGRPKGSCAHLRVCAGPQAIGSLRRQLGAVTAAPATTAPPATKQFGAFGRVAGRGVTNIRVTAATAFTNACSCDRVCARRQDCCFDKFIRC